MNYHATPVFFFMYCCLEVCDLFYQYTATTAFCGYNMAVDSPIQHRF